MFEGPASGFAQPSRDARETSADVGTANAAAVLQVLLAEGPLARAEIADRVGLTRGTVTRVTARLLSIGLLVEGSPLPSQFGRPLVPLALAGSTRLSATAHLGASEARLGLVGIDGQTVVERRIRYSEVDPASIVCLVAEGLNALISAEAGKRQVLGVGVSIGGWVDAYSGRVIRFEPLDWNDVPLARLLTEALGRPVYFDQMVRGMALAEMMFGAAKGKTDFVEIFVGNVLGAAIVVDGKVRRGPRGAAGNIAHLPVRGEHAACACGRDGCLEALASELAVVRSAKEAGVLTAADGIAELSAKAVDPGLAHDLVMEQARRLGSAASTIVDFWNPDHLVLAGVLPGIVGFADEFRGALGESGAHGRGIEVLASALGDSAPTVASAALLLDSYYRDPMKFEPVSPAVIV